MWLMQPSTRSILSCERYLLLRLSRDLLSANESALALTSPANTTTGPPLEANGTTSWGRW
jgi:hypothetical protein